MGKIEYNNSGILLGAGIPSAESLQENHWKEDNMLLSSLERRLF